MMPIKEFAISPGFDLDAEIEPCRDFLRRRKNFCSPTQCRHDPLPAIANFDALNSGDKGTRQETIDGRQCENDGCDCKDDDGEHLHARSTGLTIQSHRRGKSSPDVAWEERISYYQ